MNRPQKDDDGIVEEAKKALTEDAEVPLDKKAPGATFAVVALSYPVILACGAIVLAALLWFFNALNSPEPKSKPTSGIVATESFRSL